MQLLDHLDLEDMQKSTERRFLFGAAGCETEESPPEIAAAAAAAAAHAESKASMDVKANPRVGTKVCLNEFNSVGPVPDVYARR